MWRIIQFTLCYKNKCSFNCQKFISETFNNYDFKESETDSEYNQLDRAPGSNLIGRTYDPVRDKHGSSLLLETSEKH